MAFIPTPNVARVAIRGTLFSETVINTLWVENPGGNFTEIDLQNLNSAIASWWTAEVLTSLSQDYLFNEVTAIAQHAIDAPSASQTQSGGGTLVGGALPGSNCLTVTFKTPQRGRSGRGRNYISGIREADVIGNAVTVPWADGILFNYQQLQPTYLDPLGWQHVVVSKQLDNVPRSQGFAQEVTSYVITDRAVDSQRRRLAGRGG